MNDREYAQTGRAELVDEGRAEAEQDCHERREYDDSHDHPVGLMPSPSSTKVPSTANTVRIATT